MLIIFEGVDGVGKSTQISLLAQHLKSAGRDIIVTKEPGGTAFGMHLREILLEKNASFKASRRAEMLLFLADRAEHFDKIIAPNISRAGCDILSDRSFISGLAYALVNDEKASFSELLALNHFALNGSLPPAVYIFLKADKELLKSRLKTRGNCDIIESRGLDYLLLVQEQMSEIFATLNLKTLTLNADEAPEILHKKIANFIAKPCG